jgi:2',3'-cyclic-nucleotide 2'-phosphodiesterase (5'-nucleotidase family)
MVSTGAVGHRAAEHASTLDGLSCCERRNGTLPARIGLAAVPDGVGAVGAWRAVRSEFGHLVLLEVLMRPLAWVLLLIGTIFVSASAVPLTVLYTNDLHVRIGRLDGLASEIEEARATGDAVLWFDAGDGWHDFRRPFAMVWGSDRIVAWMNDVGLSAMAIGNHETYLGPQRLSDRISEADFPVLAANWRSDDPRIETQASVVFVVDDVRVLVIGLITPDLFPTFAYPMMTYIDPVRAVREELEAYAGKIDLVFVLAHMPTAQARVLARSIPEIDLFLTGHSHEQTEEPIVEGNALIVQAGAFGQVLGRLDLDMDDERLSVVSNELIPIETAPADTRAGACKWLSVVAAILLAAAVWWV